MFNNFKAAGYIYYFHTKKVIEIVHRVFVANKLDIQYTHIHGPYICNVQDNFFLFELIDLTGLEVGSVKISPRTGLYP